MSRAGPETAPPRLVVVTDLDGTLIGPDYRPGPSAPAVARLREAGALVVFCSSKTRAEQAPLRTELGLRGPWIVENGSALLLDEDDPAGEGLEPLPPSRWAPPARALVLGRPAGDVRDALRRARTAAGASFRMFSETPDDELGALARLDPDGVRHARTRDFSETIHGLGEGELEPLARALAPARMRISSGGRFWTVTGEGADKGLAARALRARLERDGPVTLVGLGDAENDRPLLETVDRPFVVRRPDGSWADLPGEPTEGVGPAGWAEVAERLLRELAAR